MVGNWRDDEALGLQPLYEEEPRRCSWATALVVCVVLDTMLLVGWLLWVH